MLSKNAIAVMEKTESSSFSCDLKKWFGIMNAYESNGHAYHATMPTDSLVKFENTVKETEEFGFENARDQQNYIGNSIRALLEEIGEPYELIQTTTDRLTRRPEEQMKINPNGWVPVLSWDDGAMYECAAITMFLCDRYPDCLLYTSDAADE